MSSGDLPYVGWTIAHWKDRCIDAARELQDIFTGPHSIDIRADAMRVIHRLVTDVQAAEVKRANDAIASANESIRLVREASAKTLSGYMDEITRLRAELAKANGAHDG